MSNVDMSKFIVAKSDQANADDFISGPRTITVTGIRGTDEADQPVAISFEGDEGKPFKPCKSVRRILVAAWGTEGKDYVGRSMTLYRDENVLFGGIKVGGIRVSHMSHIDKELTVVMNATRGKKMAHKVQPLRVRSPPPVSHAKTEGPSETAVIEPPAKEIDVLTIDMATATDDEVAAWCEAFKALGLKHRTPDGLRQYWKSHFEDRIAPLHTRNEAAYDVLYAWMDERLRRLKASG